MLRLPRDALSRFPGGIDAACEEACACAGALLKMGLPVYSPIAHGHPIALAAKIDPCDPEIWLPVCRPMFEAAFGLMVLSMRGWRESHGMGEELKWAAELRKPRFLVDPTTCSWQALP